jgi:hypothetical protein
MAVFMLGEIVIEVAMIAAVVGGVLLISYLLRLTIREQVDVRREERRRAEGLDTGPQAATAPAPLAVKSRRAADALLVRSRAARSVRARRPQGAAARKRPPRTV